jgi:MFS family permease
MEDLEHETKGLIISGLSINESYISGSDHDSSFIGDCSTALLSPKQGEPQRTNEDACVEQNTLYQYIRLVQGPLHLLVLCMAFALAIGATIGVVPTVMTDQYARLYHGYKDEKSCADYPFQLKPKACIQGFNDAQTANTMASFISNGLTFLTSSLIGSFSDEFGRRNLLLLSQAMSILPSFCLVLSQLDNKLNPRYYYLSSACSGIISWIAIALVRFFFLSRINR